MLHWSLMISAKGMKKRGQTNPETSGKGDEDGKKSINRREKEAKRHTEWAQSWLCFYGCGKTPQPKQHKERISLAYGSRGLMVCDVHRESSKQQAAGTAAENSHLEPQIGSRES